MLGVDLEEEPEAIAAFGKAFALPFPLLLDRDGRTQKLFGLRGHPSTALIDRQGRIVFKQIGPITPEILEHTILPTVTRLRGDRSAPIGDSR